MKRLSLSKSKYTAGLQCHKLLWLKVHEPQAPELVVGPELQAIFDQGSRVGELARSYIPGGVLIDLPYWKLEERVQATHEALEAGATTIYEAALRADDVFVSVDVLHRRPHGRQWTLTEVKSTTKVKPAHVPDAAVQTHVARRVGLPIARTEVMHLNRECRAPDLTDLFTRAEVTREVAELEPGVPAEIRAQKRMLARATPPEVEPGLHCTSPYPCPFVARCGAVEPEAPITGGEAVVRADVGESLASWRGPIAHLDFETISPAIPVWNGCRPYDQVPVQFSVRFEGSRERPSRGDLAWLASGREDPRPGLARALVEALRPARTIVVYHQPFEEARLLELASAVPELARELRSIVARLVDLLPVVRRNVAHPAFGGRFGLKRVAPALVPGCYEALSIADGAAATRTLEAMLLGDAPPARERELRASLLAYCGEDTRATMEVLAWLRQAA